MITEFKCFIIDLNLNDPPLLGRKFTWYRADGSAMSRLGRFLLSEEWIQLWGEPVQWVLNRDVSDHCPIILKNGTQDWGPKPFRFNNCWLEHPNFKEMVVGSLGELRVEGWMAYVLKEKLKFLKSVLKSWNVRCLVM